MVPGLSAVADRHGPGGFAFAARYRIGTHADGQEYIVDGDRVVSDDKDTPVSRLNINLARMLWRVLK